MTFVPFVPPAPPSPRAQELGRRLRETIDLFMRDNPGTTGLEIRQAVQIAMQGVTRAGSRAALLLAVGLAVLFLVGFLGFGERIQPGGQMMLLTSMIIIGVLLIGLIFIAKNR